MDFGKWDGENINENWASFRRDFYEGGQAPPGGESKSVLYKRSEKEIHLRSVT